MRRLLFFTALTVCHFTAVKAQQLTFSQPHGFYDAPFSVELAVSDSISHDDATIRYTLDGSEPTTASAAYTKAIEVKGTTILRAAAIADTGIVTPVATATYLFVEDVLKQSNTPAGYPDTWGAYTQMMGTAIADYEMDPEMTGNATLRPKIAEGLLQLPALSIVTDKNNLFSHENDSVTGGIYIFTGPPVGDNTGHGWTRPASVELLTSHISPLSPLSPLSSLLSPLLTEGFTTTCGLRLHGGHGRLAEKNPKHSFRLVFKEKYGPKTLEYPLFGEDEPAKFNQLVLRCHFGNAWQHWAEGNRTKAQYTRDVWARRMQRKMGWTSVNALYVHLFLNGMYWGLYNIAERVDDQFGKDRLGGKKSDIDVIKIEEDGGNHIEASEGNLEAWELMTQTARAVASSPGDNTAYYRLQGLNADGERVDSLEPLLDIDAFIDYMLINQYGGNTDWDHHNWYALRKRGTDSQGFRFLCWDTEIILENERENVLAKNNGRQSPTGIFNNLLTNDLFARQYVKRAKEVLKDDGLLGQESVVAVWDSLYNTISGALYCEAARWGDYRRDVHPWQSRGQLYTVDEHYMNERNRLLTQYFPVRTDNVLSYILGYVTVDDFEAPADWTKLTAQMFQQWDGTGADAQPTGGYNVDWNFGTMMGGGSVIAGSAGVEEYRYANLSSYGALVLRGQGSGLRLLANRLVSHGPWKQIVVSFNQSDPYWNDEYKAIVVPLYDLSDKPDTDGNPRQDGFVHLNAMKVDWSSNLTVQAAYLTPGDNSQGIERIDDLQIDDLRFVYDLQGRRVDSSQFTIHSSQLKKGVYILNGRKVLVQ
jgi:hypothetical protein